jgi:hypothetical protein
MGLVHNDTEFGDDARPRLNHVAPIARCARTGSGLSIGITHIARQPNGAPVTRHRRRIRIIASRREWASVLVVVVVSALCGALLAHGMAGGFRTAHHVAVTGGSK